jgi:hypothetical protein
MAGSFLHLKKIHFKTIFFVAVIIAVTGITTSAATHISSFAEYMQPIKPVSIKSINGKFYAHIVLLFNENPHFVNLIQKDSIPLKRIGHDGFNIKEYKNYLKTLSEDSQKKTASTLLQMYLEPTNFNDAFLRSMEKQLHDRNIILRFSRDRNTGVEKIALDYCIYGKKMDIPVKHPFIEIKDPIYNIQPFIYYDEFSTSNSTFYFDMIYINYDEVENDYIIAKKILNGENVKTMFFVGSKVTDEIRYCLAKAFSENPSIKEEIWKMFMIHELTHKILNNNYNFFDQVAGEELSLCTTLYTNPYLGLSILYSYLNYNAINPHRIAAGNIISYVSSKLNKPEYNNKPELLKSLSSKEIQQIGKDYFDMTIKRLK